MAREGVHVRHQLSLSLGGRNTAHATAKRYPQAAMAALIGANHKLATVRHGQLIEALLGGTRAAVSWAACEETAQWAAMGGAAHSPSNGSIEKHGAAHMPSLPAPQQGLSRLQ